MTSTVFFWIAAALSLAMTGGHVFVAGAIVVRPLLDDTALPPLVRWLAYFCWHVVTLLAGAMTVGFALVAAGAAPFALAVFLSALTLGCAALGGVVVARSGIPLHRFPPPILFLLVGVVGSAGVLAHL